MNNLCSRVKGFLIGLAVLLAATTIASATALAQADMKLVSISINDTLVTTNQNFNYTVSVDNFGPQPATGGPVNDFV